MAYKEPPGGAGGAVSFSAGAASAALGSIVFSNSGGVSFGLNGSTITASVGAAGGGLTNINLSAGTTSQNLSAVTFSNLNGVSFGLNGSVITGSVVTNYLTTAALSNHSHGNPTLNLTNLSGTTASNSAGFTLSLSAAAPGGGGLTNINVSAGTTSNNLSALTFNNSNGVSFGLNGSVITGTVATNYQSQGAYLTTAMQSNAATISNINVSAGTTSNNLSALTFNNSNGVSFGLNGSVVTATVATNYQSAGAYLTTAALSNHSHGNPTLNLTNLSGTTASNSAGLTLSISAGNYLTTARASTDAVGLNSAVTNVTATINSAGLSFNAAGYAGTGTSATNASITMNSNGLAISVAAPGGGGAVNFSAGSTSQNLQSVVFANSNGVTFGLGTGASSQSVTASVNAGGAGNTLSYYQNIDALNGTQTMSVFGSTVHVQPFEVPYAVSASYIRLPVSQAMTSTSWGTTASSRTGAYSRLESHNLVIYSRGAGANSQSLQYVTSTQGNLTWAVSYSVAANGTQASSTYGITFQRNEDQTNTQFSSSQSATTLGVYTNIFSNFSGPQYFAIPFDGSLSEGQYWLAYGISSSTSTSGFTNTQMNNWSLNRSFIGVSQVNSNFNLIGSTTNSTNGIQFGLGSWTTNSLGRTTSSIALSHVSTSASGMLMFFNMVRIT